MAALTQNQWFEKLKSWVPDWFFETEKFQVATFQAMAKILANADAEMRTHFDDTFLSRATGLFLDQHGSERSMERNPGEADESYSARIRNMAQALDPISMQIVVTSLLATGEATIFEHDEGATFLNRDGFFNRREIYSDINYCTFSIVVPSQGAGPSGLAVLETIATIVNRSKALGTLYRIVELPS